MTLRLVVAIPSSSSVSFFLMSSLVYSEFRFPFLTSLSSNWSELTNERRVLIVY